MYYQTLKELIDSISEKDKLDGVAVKQRFIEKYGGGSFINMNKALRLLRENEKVNFEKIGVKIFYWKIK